MTGRARPAGAGQPRLGDGIFRPTRRPRAPSAAAGRDTLLTASIAMPPRAPATLRSVTPLLPAGPDLAAALRFYSEELGFAVTWQGGGMAGLRRGGVAFNLVVSDDRAWAASASASVAVDDLDALYAEYRGTSAVVGPLEPKDWGRREFHMILASGVCLQFYQADERDAGDAA